MKDLSLSGKSAPGLLTLLSDGNKQALFELYDAYAPAVLGYINRIVNNYKIAEECLQLTFNEVWRQRATSKHSGYFFSELAKIARQCVAGKLNSAQNFETAQTCEAINLVYATLIQKYIDNNLQAVSPDFPFAFFNKEDIADVNNLDYFRAYTFTEFIEKLNIPMDRLRSKVSMVTRHINESVLHQK